MILVPRMFSYVDQFARLWPSYNRHSNSIDYTPRIDLRLVSGSVAKCITSWHGGRTFSSSRGQRRMYHHRPLPGITIVSNMRWRWSTLVIGTAVVAIVIWLAMQLQSGINAVGSALHTIKTRRSALLLLCAFCAYLLESSSKERGIVRYERVATLVPSIASAGFLVSQKRLFRGGWDCGCSKAQITTLTLQRFSRTVRVVSFLLFTSRASTAEARVLRGGSCPRASSGTA